MENKKVMRRMTNLAFGTIGAALLIYFSAMCIFFYMGEYIRGLMITAMFIVLYFLLKPIIKQIFKSPSFKEIYNQQIKN